MAKLRGRPGAAAQKLIKKKLRAFIAELAKNGIISHAARKAGISAHTVYQHRKTDLDFEAAWDAAVQEAADAMEAEALRRGVEGTVRPVFYQGEEVGGIREYSDTLLIFMLKGARPDKYREKLAIVSANIPTGRPDTCELVADQPAPTEH